jgi:hypothetical protein
MKRRSFLALAAALAATPSLRPVWAQERHFGVVYGAKTRIIRRIVIPDTNDELVGVRDRLIDGEAMALFQLPHSFGREEIQAALGPPAHSGRCCRVRDGVVIEVIMADPAVDPTINGDLIVQSDEAGHGWVWDGVRLSEPVA